MLKQQSFFCHLKDVGGSPSSASSPSPLCTGVSLEVVFNHWRLSQANLLGVGISLHHRETGKFEFQCKKPSSLKYESSSQECYYFSNLGNSLFSLLPGNHYPCGTSHTSVNPSSLLTPGQASSPWWPTKMYSISPFSKGKEADMKTPWLRLLWFLAPFPPAAPYAEILREIIVPQDK